jgi:hypothetical protein
MAKDKEDLYFAGIPETELGGLVGRRFTAIRGALTIYGTIATVSTSTYKKPDESAFGWCLTVAFVPTGIDEVGENIGSLTWFGGSPDGDLLHWYVNAKNRGYMPFTVTFH